MNDFLNIHNRRASVQDHIRKQFSGVSDMGADPSEPKVQQQQVLVKSQTSDILEKGEISGILSDNYKGEAVKFEKTGKELTELLPQVISRLESAKNILIAQMAVLAEKIGVEPADKRRSYQFKTIAYSCYPYSLCSQPYDKANECYPEASDENKWCCQYNDYAYNVVSVEEDIFACNIFLKNVEPKKKYVFTLNQLAAISV